jgi:ABC-2 type transport system permease protein
MAYQFRYNFRNRVMFVMNFIMPIGLVALFGFIFGHQTGGYNLNFFIPGIITLALINASLQNMSSLTANQIQQGIIKHFFATPLHPIIWLLSQVTSLIILNLFQATVAVLTAQWWFGFSLTGGWLSLFFIVALSGLVLVGCSLLVAVLTKKVESAQAVGTTLALLFMFLGGLWFPIPSVSPGIDFLINHIPSSFMTHALRSAAVNGEGLSRITADLAGLGVCAIVTLLVAGERFMRMKRPA